MSTDPAAAALLKASAMLEKRAQLRCYYLEGLSRGEIGYEALESEVSTLRNSARTLALMADPSLPTEEFIEDTSLGIPTMRLHVWQEFMTDLFKGTQ